jgi:cellulose synthase/poly-beta-1,6-N-acetylglucosamine synthase-like glycosyltransferase
VCTGAIYAIRRIGFRSLPEGTLVDDLLTPMRIILAGHRVVFEPKAIAFDSLSPSSSQEFARKVRTLAGNIQVLCFEPTLLNPFNRFPIWRYWSHMLLPRVLMPYCLVALLLSNVFLSDPAFKVVLALQVVIYLSGSIGLCLGSRAWLPLRAASTFLLLNAASVAGAVSYAFRPSETLWRRQPQ